MNNKKITELIGIAALVLSLIFVAWELRQSNRIAIATAEADLRAGNREANATVAENPELAGIIVKARETNASLDLVEDEILRSYASAQFNLLTQANASIRERPLFQHTRLMSIKTPLHAT